MKYLFPVFFIVSCSHLAEKTQPAEYYFNKALKYKNQGSAELALESLSKLRQNFFDSSYQQKALLLTADIYFNDDKYPQALQSYQKYQKLYPESQKDYVLYQIALSYKKQLPSWADNDLSLADSALLHLKALLALNSPYQEKALKMQKELRDKKAQKELQVVVFYQRQKQYANSFRRVQKLLQNYPDSSSQPKALLRAFQLAKLLGKDPTAFKKELLEKYPQSPESKKLTKKPFLSKRKKL